jgi:GT2 family glycosyltransferase
VRSKSDERSAQPSKNAPSECKPDRAQPSSHERSECKPDRAQPSSHERSECKPDRAQPSSEVDLLIVVHNSRHWIPGLLESLRSISVPVTAYFIDNASTDETPDLLAAAVETLPFPVHVVRSLHNNGFARAMNLLVRQSSAPFMFLLNPDTQLEPGCLETLLDRARTDDRIGICEARQAPREHPKAWDRLTGETTWCSGAAALIRREAFEEVAGFDERLYFMYCEDVDLSWTLWLKGWKCIYEPAAVVQHFTQDVVPGKRRTRENYFSFRNSLFLYYRFGLKKDRSLFWKFIRRRLFSRAYSLTSKALFTIALVEHIRYIPYLLHGERIRCGRDHPWVRLRETSLSH